MEGEPYDRVHTVAAMTAGKVASVSLSEGEEIRENTRPVTLDATACRQVKAIRSSMTFAEAVSGNIVLRAGVQRAWPVRFRPAG